MIGPVNCSMRRMHLPGSFIEKFGEIDVDFVAELTGADISFDSSTKTWDSSSC